MALVIHALSLIILELIILIIFQQKCGKDYEALTTGVRSR
jgi:hypothetical protein